MRYAIMIIDTYGMGSIVLLPDKAAIEQYKIAHANYLQSVYLWYVVEVLERSQAESVAAIEFMADTERKRGVPLPERTPRNEDAR